MVYVHAWTGLSGGELEMARGTPQESLRWVLMETFGRSSVPLLGMISGWLVSRSSRTAQWQTHIANKAKSILLPMVLWNIIAVILVSGTAWLFTLPAPIPHSLPWLLNEIFIYSHPPDISVQMPFLRDLFVCMVVAPILIRLPSQALFALATLAAIGHIFGFGQPVILRPSLLMFFVLGILAQKHRMDQRIASLPWAYAVSPFLALLAVSLYCILSIGTSVPAQLKLSLELCTRIAAAMAVWKIVTTLASTKVTAHILKIEPYIFFFFCFHLIALWLGGPAIGSITGPLGAPLYPIYLVAQPFLILGLAIMLAKILLRIAPNAARILSGGRLKSRSHTQQCGALSQDQGHKPPHCQSNH